MSGGVEHHPANEGLTPKEARNTADQDQRQKEPSHCHRTALVVRTAEPKSPNPPVMLDRAVAVPV